MMWSKRVRIAAFVLALLLISGGAFFVFYPSLHLDWAMTIRIEGRVLDGENGKALGDVQVLFTLTSHSGKWPLPDTMPRDRNLGASDLRGFIDVEFQGGYSDTISLFEDFMYRYGEADRVTFVVTIKKEGYESVRFDLDSLAVDLGEVTLAKE